MLIILFGEVFSKIFSKMTNIMFLIFCLPLYIFFYKVITLISVDNIVM